MKMEEITPKTFISYSHDSREHKRWVAMLATKLRENGVDVILDQWDLRLGDDLTKFMEESLSTSDRVFLICTETYVHKANAGVGGVAYEKMIVTAEIVQEIGTNKFIPIIKQSVSKIELPIFLGHRYFVDFSNEEKFADKFDELLREIHKQPILQKPALGKNPFAQKPSGEDIPEIKHLVSLQEITIKTPDPIAVYDLALETARQGDIIGWRKLVKEARAPTRYALQKYRNEKFITESIIKASDLPVIADEVVGLFAPTFAVAIAGIQSGREKFLDQKSIIDDLLSPFEWNWSGITWLVNLPELLGFVFQSIYGAACLDTNQIDQAIELALMKLEYKFGPRDAEYLFQYPGIIGWPDSLEHDCTKSWSFMFTATDRWEWLLKAFGTKEDFQIALIAYHLCLNSIEFAVQIASGKTEALKSNGIRFEVPPTFLVASDALVSRAYKQFLRSDPKKIWTRLNIKKEDLEKYWPLWVEHIGGWLSRLPGMWYGHTVPMSNLIRDSNI